MAGESVNGRRSIDRVVMGVSDRRRALLIAAAVAAGIAGAASAWVGARLFVRGVRTARIALRFAYAVATLGLYRRCPDCRRLIRADARVCAHCGYRRPPRGRRARRRARREARDQIATAA
jgi:Uncharacterised protein family UPF0547